MWLYWICTFLEWRHPMENPKVPSFVHTMHLDLMEANIDPELDYFFFDDESGIIHRI